MKPQPVLPQPLEMTEEEARRVIDAANMKEHLKARMFGRWKRGDRDTRFVVTALAKQQRGAR
jgi:hypothetical protein